VSSKQTASQEILSNKDLLQKTVSLMTDGFSSKENRLIGMEIELPLFDENLKPITYADPEKGLKKVLEALVAKHGWHVAESENGNPLALVKNKNMVMLEPGGQIEFAGAARKTMTDVKEDFSGFLQDLESVCEEMGIDALPFGFHPHTEEKDCPFVHESSRFTALLPIFEAEGSAAWQQACSVQVTLDAATKDSAFDDFRFGLALQPVAAAIFANSPFADAKNSQCQSWRRKSLQQLDSPYYAVPESIYDSDFGIQDWAEYVLTVPMSFVVRNGQYIAVADNPFEDMVGKPLPELSHLPESQQYLTACDLKDHLTGIKPDMLLKPGLLLECRAADLGPDQDHMLAVGAFWVGLMYDEKAYQAASDYIGNWTAQDRKIIHDNVAEKGLDTPVGQETMQEAALGLLAIAREGLMRIDPDSAPMLDKVMEQVAQGATPATKALLKYENSNQNMEKSLRQSFMFAAAKKDKGLEPEKSINPTANKQNPAQKTVKKKALK